MSDTVVDKIGYRQAIELNLMSDFSFAPMRRTFNVSWQTPEFWKVDG